MKPPSWAQLLGQQVAWWRLAAQPWRGRRPAASAAGQCLPGAVATPAGPRRYLLFRPAGTAFGERLPLLVMLHGCHQDAAGFAASTRMNRLAARERFLVLYPEQPRLAQAQGCWHWFDLRGGRALAELAWVLAAIEQVSLFYAADRQRTAVLGLSAGASLAALLASRHPQRFAAVVMHSGLAPGAADSPTTAMAAMQGRRAGPPPARAAGPWPPLLVIQGDGDRVVHASNGAAAANWWATAAGAAAEAPRVLQRGQRYPLRITAYQRGGELAVELVEVIGLGHAWSGGAAGQRFGDARGPDASRLAWRFVQRQFSRRR